MQAASPKLWENKNCVHKLLQGCFCGEVHSLLHLYSESQRELARSRTRSGESLPFTRSLGGTLEWPVPPLL